MISIKNLSDFYARNIEIIKMQTEGLSHQDSLIQLPFRANCLNWVVGHVLANRCNILALLGAQDLRPELDLGHYERESEPISGDGPAVLLLEELIHHLEQSQIRLAAALENESEKSLQRSAPYRDRGEKPVGFWLIFLYFHDSYHVGQTEILRQAAGKGDKII